MQAVGLGSMVNCSRRQQVRAPHIGWRTDEGILSMALFFLPFLAEHYWNLDLEHAR